MGVDDNRLLVEGADDKRVLPELLERAGVAWGPKGAEVVKIHAIDGFSNLTLDELRLQLKTAGLRRLGVLFDADEDPAARWQAVRAIVGELFVLPLTPPESGTIVPSTAIAPRFGIWMMPDNGTRGMLETFLLALRPANEPTLLAHAKESAEEASQLGAPFKIGHRDKALIHTWLAWRDPPGRQLHQAIKERMLDPTVENTTAFVTWFKTLFELQ